MSEVRTHNQVSNAGHTLETAPTQFIETGAIRFAYRRFGAAGGIPLLFLQHFTGTMDSWDPAMVDGFARERSVVLFDNRGVSRSSGATPDNVSAMADDARTFIAALGLERVDLLGFSLGGFVAQALAAKHPELVRRVILAGTGPEGGEGIRDLGRVLAQAQQASPVEPRLYLFFSETQSSQRAGRAFIERQARRTRDRDPDSSEQTVNTQFKAIVDWGDSPGPQAATRLQRIAQPVLVVNGKTDVMVPASNSYALFQALPNATLLLYPDSGHGALFQYADDFVAQSLRFLAAPGEEAT
jgi:pimeloyl-ACP methyl ester carboxylesterase